MTSSFFKQQFLYISLATWFHYLCANTSTTFQANPEMLDSSKGVRPTRDLHWKAATHRCARATVLSRDGATEQRLLKAVSHIAHLLKDFERAQQTTRAAIGHGIHCRESSEELPSPRKKAYGRLRKDVNKSLPETTVHRHGEMYRAWKGTGGRLRSHRSFDAMCLISRFVNFSILLTS